MHNPTFILIWMETHWAFTRVDTVYYSKNLLTVSLEVELGWDFTRLKVKWNPCANQTEWGITCIFQGYGLSLLYHRWYSTPPLPNWNILVLGWRFRSAFIFVESLHCDLVMKYCYFIPLTWVLNLILLGFLSFTYWPGIMHSLTIAVL